MEKAENAYNQLLNGIKDYVLSTSENIPRDITGSATIRRVNGNGTYDIMFGNVVYTNIKTLGGICKPNETVKVLIPQGQYNNMFILKSSEVTREQYNDLLKRVIALENIIKGGNGL